MEGNGPTTGGWCWGEEPGVLSLFLNHAQWWIFAVLLLAGLIAVRWLYRLVPPTVGPGLKAGLVALRSLALVLLLLVVMEPVLSLTRVARERPLVAVLLDASRSMSIRDATGGTTRAQEALSLLNEVVIPKIARDSELRAFAFSSSVSELETERLSIVGPPTTEGGATDIGNAFKTLTKKLEGRNVGAVVIATDGANNRGSSAYDAGLSLGVPVFGLGVGRIDPGADIAVREVVTNRISYAGESLPIRVRLSSVGFADAETVVELREGNTLLDAATIRLSGTGEELELTFRVVPGSPGVHTYTVSVPTGPDELTTANNSRVVATTAFKGKIKALLVASRPSWDFAFLRHGFESDRSVELVAFAVKGGAQVEPVLAAPKSREELYAYDLVVLVEPDWDDAPVLTGWLSGFVRDRGGGLLVVGPPRGSGAGAELADALPVARSGPAAGRAVEVRPKLTAYGESDPTTRVVSDRFRNVEAWAALPPVWVAVSPPAVARDEAKTLVAGTGAGADNVPLVVAARAGAGGVIAVPAEGLWRWKMAGDDEVDVLGRFVANAARWLTARGELERVVASTDRDVYPAGDAVSVSAQVYREDYRLTRNATVTVSIATGSGAAPVGSLVLRGDGDFYRGEAGPLAPGRYIYEARATVGGEDVGAAAGEFTVEAFSLEDAEVRRRPALLKKLADDSGGAYFSPETIDDFPGSVPLDWSRRTTVREFELWNSPWLLLAFVGLVSAEWTLRRRKGLP